MHRHKIQCKFVPVKMNEPTSRKGLKREGFTRMTQSLQCMSVSRAKSHETLHSINKGRIEKEGITNLLFNRKKKKKIRGNKH